MPGPAIRVEHVIKDFVVFHNRSYTLKERLLALASARFRQSREDFRAVDDVSFSVAHGESLALLGRNGSGKSTLLKLIAGILVPTQGQVEVSGRVAPLIELGAGFNPRLTGEENIFLNGTLYGLTNRQIRSLYPSIVEFSELGRFIDVPLKNYSSGMQMRLGFSVAVHLEPDILLADEILAVGDSAFQSKCLEAIRSMRSRGLTLLLVTHSPESVQEFCDRYIELDEGRMVREGMTRDLIDVPA